MFLFQTNFNRLKVAMQRALSPVIKENKMLLNLTKTRINYACRYISTTSARWQGAELVKKRDDHDVIGAIEKKPQREPLVKNFFVYKVDTELMAYPEAIFQNDHLEIVNRRKQQYGEFLSTNIFENPDDVNNIRKLKEFGAFHPHPPLVTESIYGYREPESQYLSYSTFLDNHQQVLKLLIEFGDETLKLKYLPKLESGELTAIPCVFEANHDIDGKKTFLTEAVYKDGTDEWILNGEKNFLLISPAFKDSTAFLVIAAVEKTDRKGDFEEGMAAIIVDGSLPGVSISGVDQTIGYDEKVFNQVSVKFDNVSLKPSDVFKEDGLKVAMALLTSLRLQKGVQALGMMKPILENLTKHAIDTKLMGIHMKDVDTIKEQLGSLTSDYYALESMVFMTAGLIDIYEKQDVEIESAMIQAFAFQIMTDFIARPLHGIGPQVFAKGGDFDRYVRDATQLVTSGENLDSVRQFAALSGFRHAGRILAELTMKNRNPLHHPAFIFSRILNNTSIERPKLKLFIDRFLHPSLEPAAKFLETSIYRLLAASEILLSRHGELVFKHTVELGKMAEAATLCYAMFASLARASRSYCIGLRNADHEMHLAHILAYKGMIKVKEISKEIDNGEYGTGEHTYKMVGEKLIETKKYHLEHPTTRNF